MSVELRRAERRKACFYFIRRRDRLDADVEFIRFGQKNSTLITLASTGAIYRRNTLSRVYCNTKEVLKV